MEQNYLLTYQQNEKQAYGWFESEEDMQQFVDETRLDDIHEALEIKGAVEVEIKFEKSKKRIVPFLTENEKTELLYMKLRGFEYIVKNEIGSVTVHKEEPEFFKRGSGYGHWHYELPIRDHSLEDDLRFGHYSFLSFEDDPIRIETLFEKEAEIVKVYFGHNLKVHDMIVVLESEKESNGVESKETEYWLNKENMTFEQHRIRKETIPTATKLFTRYMKAIEANKHDAILETHKKAFMETVYNK